MTLEWGYQSNEHGYELAWATIQLAHLWAGKNATQQTYTACSEGKEVGRHETTGHATLDDAKAAAVALAVQALEELYQAERAKLGVGHA